MGSFLLHLVRAQLKLVDVSYLRNLSDNGLEIEIINMKYLFIILYIEQAYSICLLYKGKA